MIALGWLGAVALAVAFAFLIRSLLIRFPIEETVAVGDWKAPGPAQRIGMPERGFDQSIHRIDLARSEPEEWTKLLAHLDGIADILDPNPVNGERPVLAHRRGRKIWEHVDRNGVPTTFNSDYLARRLSHLENRSSSPDARRTQ